MKAPTLPLTLDSRGDASLDGLLADLGLHDDRPLLVSYADRLIPPGHHVTEVKAGSFATLYCSGNPDTWRETILQVEDLPASAQMPTHMIVGRFLAILTKVGHRVQLEGAARLTFEIGGAG